MKASTDTPIKYLIDEWVENYCEESDDDKY